MKRANMLVLLVPLALLPAAFGAGARAGDAQPAGSLVVDVSGLEALEPPALAPDVAKRGAALFESRCSLCHGPRGAGDGPAARGLRPAPRSFADSFWQASVDDAHLKAVILGGGAARKLSPLMPASTDLEDEPAALDALIAHIRSLQGPTRTVVVTVEGGPDAAPVRRVERATASPAGGARVELGGLAPGRYALTAAIAPGVVHCGASVVVTPRVKAHVLCAPAPSEEGKTP